MLRTGGRYVLGGLVNRDANVTIDANVVVRQWITLRGIDNYHRRQAASTRSSARPESRQSGRTPTAVERVEAPADTVAYTLKFPSAAILSNPARR